MTYEDTPEEALARNLHRIKTEGLDAAVSASIEILRDLKAPAQARSATINATYRAAGLFGQQDDDGGELEPHEMTPAQLSREIAKLEKHMMSAAKGAVSDEEPDAFA